MQETKSLNIKTSLGMIAVETRGAGFPVVFIHGNVACRAVFQKQMMSPWLDGYRLISFELPGPGDSSEAEDGTRPPLRPGLTDLVIELLAELGIDHAAIVGASLGGHVAIEMLSRSGMSRGQVLTGLPPMGPNFPKGFVSRPLNGMASRGELTAEEAREFAHFVFGGDFEPFLRQAIERTYLGAAREPADVGRTRDDNLRRAKCLRMLGAAHSPLWEIPHIVNRLSSEFFKELTGMGRN